MSVVPEILHKVYQLGTSLRLLQTSSGGAEVLASGIVIAFRGNPITFNIGELKLVVEFIDETASSEARVQKNLLDEKTLKITFFNTNSPFGLGSSEPEPLGGFEGRKLYMHYRIYPLEKSDKSLLYTFYLGEEAKKE